MFKYDVTKDNFTTISPFFRLIFVLVSSVQYSISKSRCLVFLLPEYRPQASIDDAFSPGSLSVEHPRSQCAPCTVQMAARTLKQHNVWSSVSCHQILQALLHLGWMIWPKHKITIYLIAIIFLNFEEECCNRIDPSRIGI